MKDISGVEIKAGDRLRHTTHGGICYCEGTDCEYDGEKWWRANR